MKAEELMIGDWVLWHGKYVQVASVSGIIYSFGQQDVLLAHCNDERVLEKHITKSLSPIPLTAEILEKNDFNEFKYDYDIDECVADGSHYITLKVYTYEEDGVLIEYCNGHVKVTTDFNEEVSKNMNYVHELQHALHLCGIEKEIKL